MNAQGGATYVAVLSFSSVSMNAYFQHSGNPPIAMFTCDDSSTVKTGAWAAALLVACARDLRPQTVQFRAALRTGRSR